MIKFFPNTFQGTGLVVEGREKGGWMRHVNAPERLQNIKGYILFSRMTTTFCSI